MYPGIKVGPLANTEPTEDCAIDWPDFSDDGAPIHLDTCIIMRNPDTVFCSCGLAILERFNAKFS